MICRSPVPCVRSRRIVRCSASNSIKSKRVVTFLHRSIRSGERIEADGDVVVHGDVPPDGSIEAAGDIMCWGRLSGHAHAGAAGDTAAKISALELRGAHLQISAVTSLAAARITAPGPHTATVARTGNSHMLSMQLRPLGPPHPPAAPSGLSRDFRRWCQWYPAAAAALMTGAYAMVAGAALLVAPKTVLGLLFDASELAVAPGWIRIGGVLFATFGLQYAGTALADYWQCSNSSSGVPGLPFRPARPDAATVQQQQPGLAGGAVTVAADSNQQLDEAQHHAAATAALAASLHSCEGLPPQGPSAGPAAAGAASYFYSSTGFYEASVWSRLWLAAMFGALVAAGQCQLGLLVLALVNCLGALAMMQALRRQWATHVLGEMPSSAAQWM